MTPRQQSELVSLIRRRRRIDRTISHLLDQEHPEHLPWHLTDEQQDLIRAFGLSPEAQLQPAQVRVVGADGARAGWAAVELFDRQVVKASVFPDLRSLLDEYGSRAEVIAVDMPIGLTYEGGREADRAARAFVGPRLRSTVFPSPPRWALEAPDYAAARALRPDGAKGVGAQTFALVPKIREIAALVGTGENLYEVHPEVSFRALKGAPLEWPKRTSEGREERLEILESVGILPPLDLPPRASMVDVIDACAAAWSAHRIATKCAGTLPKADTLDWRPMTIWY